MIFVVVQAGSRLSTDMWVLERWWKVGQEAVVRKLALAFALPFGRSPRASCTWS